MAASRYKDGYAIVNLTMAVNDMASSDSPLADRIYNVFISHLKTLRPEDFPDELRGLWESIYTMLTVEEDLYGLGRVKTTLDRMDSEHLVSVAEKIVKLRNELQCQD